MLKENNIDKAFIIIGYTDTLKKEEYLKSLLLKLKENNTSIILITHNIPSKEIINLTDYFLYDKENPLLLNHKNTLAYNWFYFSEHRLKSLYNSTNWFNTGLSVLKMIWEGLSLAKTLGYKKCQLFDYDTQILNFDEIENNFELLNNYDVIGYKTQDFKTRLFAYPQYLSFNLNKYSYEELDYFLNKDIIIDKFKTYLYNGMSEFILAELLINPKNYLIKEATELKDKINLDLVNPSTDRDSYCFVPFEHNNSIHFYLRNINTINNNDLEFKVVFNKKHYFTQTVSPSVWFWLDSFLSLEELETIELFIDNNFILKYNFIDDINKEHFKNHSIFNHQNDIIDED